MMVKDLVDAFGLEQIVQPYLPGGDPLIASEQELSPLQTALIAAAISTQGMRPAPVIVSAVNTPASGWVLLPGEGQPLQVIQPSEAETRVRSLSSDNGNIWEYVAVVSQEDRPPVTWYVAGTFINISGANRELTEGITALVAAAMLIYVGFWLHKQTYAIQWQHFIRTKVSQSLTNSALTGLAVVAFLAVYREVFESILFFHTLWLQTDAGGHTHIIAGMTTAVVMLVLIAWAVFKFSVRLPLKLFFRVNSVFLYLLAIVFAGKGIAALQEAGRLPIDPVRFFEVDALGIYPNAESLGAQAALIGIAVILLFFNRFKLRGTR